MSSTQRNGGELIVDVLERQGVRHLFTLCGGYISPILVAAEQRGIRIIDVRDEANAAFAADAASRLTGVPGVCAVTAGPDTQASEIKHGRNRCERKGCTITLK